SGGLGKVVVITKDSDLLAYCSVDTVLRPNPKDSGFILYEKDKVVEALGLHHKSFLTLYAIGLKNDFAHNVKTVGPVTNLELVIKIEEPFYPKTMETLDSGVKAVATKYKGKQKKQESASASSSSSKRGLETVIGDERLSKRPFGFSLDHMSFSTATKNSSSSSSAPQGPLLEPKSSSAMAGALSSSSFAPPGPSISAPIIPVTPLPGFRELLHLWCQAVSAKVKKNVRAERFENALRTFCYRSQLCLGETPESHPDLVPLFEDPISVPENMVIWPDEEDTPEDPKLDMTVDELEREYYSLLKMFADAKSKRPEHQPPSAETIRTYHHHKQYNQFSHVFRKDEGILQGRHIPDISACLPEPDEKSAQAQSSSSTTA
ncbi:hypothetical protein BGZ83_003968, partial [Gryganskiella cystojenkinii]